MNSLESLMDDENVDKEEITEGEEEEEVGSAVRGERELEAMIAADPYPNFDMPTYMDAQGTIRTDLHITLEAFVINSWRDNDGYGNEDSDAWTMKLRIPFWVRQSNWRTDELLARTFDSEPLGNDKLYTITGALYIDPGKEWTQTYVEIGTATPSTRNETEIKETKPKFKIVADVVQVGEKHLFMEWSTFDGYQSAMYTQFAKLNFQDQISTYVIAEEARDAEAPVNVLGMAYLEGTLPAEDQYTWELAKISLIGPRRDPKNAVCKYAGIKESNKPASSPRLRTSDGFEPDAFDYC